MLIILLLLLLFYFCQLSDNALLKGLPFSPWQSVLLISTASFCALLGKRFLNSISAVFLGGIGGVFGTQDPFAGPYGGVVGLVVGALVVATPAMYKSRPEL